LVQLMRARATHKAQA